MNPANSPIRLSKAGVPSIRRSTSVFWQKSCNSMPVNTLRMSISAGGGSFYVVPQDHRGQPDAKGIRGAPPVAEQLRALAAFHPYPDIAPRFHRRPSRRKSAASFAAASRALSS